MLCCLLNYVFFGNHFTKYIILVFDFCEFENFTCAALLCVIFNFFSNRKHNFSLFFVSLR